MNQVEFFFDCSSPWTYLAFHRIEALADQAGARLLWRPFLVGGVFNTVNASVYEQRANPTPRKFRYYAKDLADWARFYDLTLTTPSVFPVNSVRAMRGCLVALEAGCLPAYARGTFESYWGRGEDISQDAVLAAIAEQAGLDPRHVAERIEEPATKQALRDNTDALIARGGFGTPTLFVNRDDMYFGNDRLVLVEEALRDARE